MTVKPALRPDLKHAVWNNLDPSGQPIDANVISSSPSGKDDGAAARQSGRQEIDCRK